MKELIIDNNNPRHIAIIMDGNGRWAVKKKCLELWGIKKVLKRSELLSNTA